MATETVTLTSGTSWLVPWSWRNDNNLIICVGGGGGGADVLVI
jgi:hypothetical protein